MFFYTLINKFDHEWNKWQYTYYKNNFVNSIRGNKLQWNNRLCCYLIWVHHLLIGWHCSAVDTDPIVMDSLRDIAQHICVTIIPMSSPHINLRNTSSSQLLHMSSSHIKLRDTSSSQLLHMSSPHINLRDTSSSQLLYMSSRHINLISRNICRDCSSYLTYWRLKKRYTRRVNQPTPICICSYINMVWFLSSTPIGYMVPIICSYRISYSLYK